MEESVNLLQTPAVLKDAMLYSLTAGGKRIRPLLLFATLDALGKDPEQGLFPACAIEMLHTYSLIHDDLPSMDDDDLRRGKPTNHKVFGEANAILAGDALLTVSFQMIAEAPEQSIPLEAKLELIRELALAAGAEGMVGGQTADIEGEDKSLNIEELEYIHSHKTGKLLTYSVMAGAVIAGANMETKRYLHDFSMHLGLAFQIRDDLLDLDGNEEILGKPVGSDEDKHKSTYPALLGVEGAKAALEQQIAGALTALEKTGAKTALLQEITDLVAKRDH
nr:farnesyl diphosphate synthase [Bacillus benzoevorans]